MSYFKYNGGSIRSSRDPQNIASVEYILRKEGETNWRIYLAGVPRLRNFNRGENLIYNTKGTNNINADNDMTVLAPPEGDGVGGPGYYICTGPDKLNI